jgi:hypothetical protein
MNGKQYLLKYAYMLLLICIKVPAVSVTQSKSILDHSILKHKLINHLCFLEQYVKIKHLKSRFIYNCISNKN